MERLANEPEYEVGRGIEDDWPFCEETLASRSEQLPRLLATVGSPGTLLEWSV